MSPPLRGVGVEQRPVVRRVVGGYVLELEVATRGQVAGIVEIPHRDQGSIEDSLKALLQIRPPIREGERHDAAVNVVKVASEGPRLLQVVYLESYDGRDAVGRVSEQALIRFEIKEGSERTILVGWGGGRPRGPGRY